MALSDREAADLRKEDAVANAYRALRRHQEQNRHQPGLGFRNGLIEAVGTLKDDLIALYADLEGAGEAPLRDELVKVVTDRVTAFIQSSVAGVRGDTAAPAAREGARLIASYSIGVGRDFDLAVHARMKDKQTASTRTAVTNEEMELRRIVDGKRLLLGPVLDLQDGINRYLRVLGEDRGISARMSRSSHLELFLEPGRRIDAAWRTARVDLRKSGLARSFEITFEERLAPLRPRTDAPEHEDLWDDSVRALGIFVEQLIGQLDNESPEDELLALGYKEVTSHCAGGYGVVYRAVDNLGAVSALKVLNPHPSIPPERAVPRFRREAEALITLRHPNVVKYRRLITFRKREILEMEFVEGTTLLDWVKPESGNVTYSDRVRAIISLLRGVQYIHEQGVFHRDIKPDNVLVQADGSIVLVDFGLAWILGRVDTNLTTQTTWSLDYAPPEVREDPEQSRGPNHDIYSVGIVLHQLLTGRRTIAGPLADHDAALAGLDGVLLCAVAPLHARFTTAGQFADALESALSDVEQPWLARTAQAALIRSRLLGEALVGAAQAAEQGDLQSACAVITGCFEALRIHVQRYYRRARGSDAPETEDRLPAVFSPAAAFVFRQYPKLCLELKPAEDKYGEAALASAGFTMSTLALFHRLGRAIDPIQSKRQEAPLDETELLAAHERLADRILALEQTDRVVLEAFDAHQQVEVRPSETSNQPLAPTSIDDLLVALANHGDDNARGHAHLDREQLARIASATADALADMLKRLESRGFVRAAWTLGNVLPLDTQLTHDGREAAHRLGASVVSPVEDADALLRRMVASDQTRNEVSCGALGRLLGWTEARTADAARVLHDQGRGRVRQRLGPDGVRFELTAEGRASVS